MFGAVILAKNADFDKYKCFSYVIGFDRREICYVIIFGADMSSSVDVDNKKKDILILGEGSTQRLGEHSLTAQKMYSINFT